MPFETCSIISRLLPGSHPPFRSWKYRPTYLPEPLCIDIAMNVAVLAEPMLFYLAFGRRPDLHPAVKPE